MPSSRLGCVRAISRSRIRPRSSTSSALTVRGSSSAAAAWWHPNVLRAGGLDPEEWSGFAFGFGIDRMAKERHGIEDIREMFQDDIRFMEQF